MPINAIITVQFTGNASQLTNTLVNLATQAGVANANVKQLNSNLNTTTRTATAASKSVAGFASSVGAFYLLNKATMLSSSLLREGFTAAADLELALNELGIVANTSADQLSFLRNEALRLSAAFGPIDVIDVVKGMTSLGRALGPGQQRIIADFTGEMAAFQNAMVLVSGGSITAQSAAEAAKTTLAAFGGFGSGTPDRLAYMSEVLDLLFKTTARYSGGKLQEIMRAVNMIAPSMIGIGMKPLDIFSAAALRTMFPSGGLRASGADIMAAVNAALSVGTEMQKGSKQMRARKREAYTRLGLMTPEGKPTIIDPKTGAPSLDRFFTSLNRSIAQIRKTTRPEDFAATITDYFETAFSRDVGKRFAMTFVQEGSLGIYHAIETALREGMDPTEFSAKMERGLWGALGRFTSNFSNILTQAFMSPAGGLAQALDYLAERMKELTAVMSKHPAIASAAGVGAVGAGVGLSAGALGTMFLGAAHALRVDKTAGWIARLIPAVLGFVGRGAMIIALGAGIASIIAGAIVLAAYAYENSATVRNAVEAVKEAVKRVLRMILPPPEAIEEGKPEATFEESRRRMFITLDAEVQKWAWYLLDIFVGLLSTLQGWAGYVYGNYIQPIVATVVGWFKTMWEMIKAGIELMKFTLNPMNWFNYSAEEFQARINQMGFGEFVGPPAPPPAWMEGGLPAWSSAGLDWARRQGAGLGALSGQGEAATPEEEVFGARPAPVVPPELIPPPIPKVPTPLLPPGGSAATVPAPLPEILTTPQVNVIQPPMAPPAAATQPAPVPEAYTQTPMLPGGVAHRLARWAAEPPAKPLTQAELDAAMEREKEAIFGQPRPLDTGQGKLTDLPPSGAGGGTNSNAKVAATMSQVEMMFERMLSSVATQAGGGMARTGTINRQLMPIRAR